MSYLVPLSCSSCPVAVRRPSTAARSTGSAVMMTTRDGIPEFMISYPSSYLVLIFSR